MTMPALASSPRMVGRRDELDSLLDAFDEGRDGHPRTAIVRGEAGIGKTRLIQEFLTEVSARPDDDLPIVIAIGQCIDLGPIGAPFGPIRRVLRDLHAAVGTDALRDAAGSPAVISTLATLVPGIAADTTPADDLTGEFAEAIEVLLEALSGTRHLVVVIEDLQWADAATLALLKTLASTLRGRHLTIVASYRSDDIDRYHPLRPVLAELDRTRAIVRLEIRPLSADEVAEQVAQLGSSDRDDAEVMTLADRSGGIPFLVEELVDIGDAGLPDTLRDLVLARYARLGDEAQETVRAMAAGGIHTDHDVLQAVSRLDEQALDVALREALDARAIVADGAGYSFRHALTQEAVHGEMLPSERVRVHQRYAEYLGEHRADSPEAVSAVAEHWLAARNLTAAFDATVAALAQSRATYSPATSAKLAERLTELWDQVPDAATRAGTTLPQLHLDAAQAWHDLGEPERALRSANEGLAVCTDDPLVRAALLRQRFVHVYNIEHTGRGEDLDEAIALLETSDDPRARILLSRVLSNVAIGDHTPSAGEHLRRAISLAEEADDDAALAVALTTEMWRIADDEDDEPRALPPIERALTLRLNPALRAYAGSAQVELLVRLGRFDEAALIGERHFSDAVRAGIERGSGSSIAVTVAEALFAAGRADEAIRYARRAQRLLDRPSKASAVRLLASHYAWDDEPATRDALLAAERGVIDETLRAHAQKSGWWAIDRGDAILSAPGTAARPVDGAEWDEAAQSVMMATEGDGRSFVRRQAALTGALLLSGGARTPRAYALRRRIDEMLGDWSGHGTAPIIADFIRASFADDDLAPLEGRIERWRSVATAGEVLPVWHRHLARCRLAAALLEAGDREEAATLLAAVAAEGPGQGVARVARWAEELAAHAGLASVPRPAPHDATGVNALTPREAQVLELIAEGLTNREIGARLFISPKTASVHVSAILAKIGASNRAEAAAAYARPG